MRIMIEGHSAVVHDSTAVFVRSVPAAVVAPRPGRRVPRPAETPSYAPEGPSWSRTQERYASTAVGSVGKIRSSPTDAVRP